MKIDIDQFNLKDVPVNPDAVFTFPGGLSGFEGCTRFTLFHEEGKPTVFWLQSLDDPSLAFSVVPPDALGVEYQIELSDADIALLGLTDPADALVVVIIYRDSETGGTPAGKIAASTRFPLVLNPKTRLGMQKILMEVQSSVVYRAR
jgi:flagellar assembly factor FliW